ncbi:hypothetical protein ACHAWF_017341 [Thalassiosira exigua]
MCQDTKIFAGANEPRSSTMRCMCFGLIVMATASLGNNPVEGFSVGDIRAYSTMKPSFASQRVKAAKINSEHTLQLRMRRNEEDSKCSESYDRQRTPGRKRALLRKYGKAIALSTTLVYGPIASVPSARRTLGSAHAASTMSAPAPTDDSAYNFKDFKDIKGKLSLAPGANVHQYEEVLAKVEVEGEKALEDIKYGDKEAALTIGEGGETESSSSSDEGEVTGRRTKRAERKAQKKKQKKSEVSEWESDEFGFGDEEDEDFDSGVLSLGGSTTSSGKTGPSKSKGGDSGGGGGGDVMITDKMAYNNYKPSVSKEEQIKLIKKGAFLSIFPVFVITTIRGRIRAWKEKKWVKQGLAIVEEERQKYLEEKKKQREGKKDDDDDDDDDDSERKQSSQ